MQPHYRHFSSTNVGENARGIKSGSQNANRGETSYSRRALSNELARQKTGQTQPNQCPCMAPIPECAPYQIDPSSSGHIHDYSHNYLLSNGSPHAAGEQAHLDYNSTQLPRSLSGLENTQHYNVATMGGSSIQPEAAWSAADPTSILYFRSNQTGISDNNHGYDPAATKAALPFEHKAIDTDEHCRCSCGKVFNGRSKNARSNRRRHMESFNKGAQHACRYAAFGCKHAANRADNIANHHERCRYRRYCKFQRYCSGISGHSS